MPLEKSAERSNGPAIADLDELYAFTRRIVTMPVRDPVTDRPLAAADGAPVTIDVRNGYSSAYRRAEFQSQGDWRQDHRSAFLASPPPDFLEDRAAKLAAAATVSWSGIVLDGGPIELTPEAAARLYRRFPWLQDQVSAACHDHGRFADPSLPTELEQDDGD